MLTSEKQAIMDSIYSVMCIIRIFINNLASEMKNIYPYQRDFSDFYSLLIFRKQ